MSWKVETLHFRSCATTTLKATDPKFPKFLRFLRKKHQHERDWTQSVGGGGDTSLASSLDLPINENDKY